MKNLVLAAVFAVLNVLSITAYSNVGFDEYIIDVEIRWDENYEDEKDQFKFTLRTLGGDPSPLVLNSKFFDRKSISNRIKELTAVLELEEESDTDRVEIKQRLLDEIEMMLNASFMSQFLVLDYSKELVSILRSIDPDHSVAMQEVKDKINNSFILSIP